MDRNAHRYDQPELDDVIGGLHGVAQDRNMLSDDLSGLRDYREHHENWR